MKGFQKVGEEFLTVDVFGVPDNLGGKRCGSVIAPLQEFVAGRLAVAFLPDCVGQGGRIAAFVSGVGSRVC